MRVERLDLGWSNPAGRRFGPEAALTGVTLAAGILAAALAASGAAPLILPALSLVLLAVGLLIAATHWNDPASSKRLTYKDVGAALVFAGFAAALMSDPAHFVPPTEQTQATALR